MLKLIRYVLILLIVLMGISFALLNATSVELNYYLGNVTWPLSLLLVLAFGFGILFGLLGTIGFYIKQKRHMFQLKRELKLAQKQAPKVEA